jgi:cytochrome c5
MRKAGILKSQPFTVLLFVFSLALVTIAGASPPGEDELKQLAAQEKAKPAAPSGPDGDYVGSATCITCHQDQGETASSSTAYGSQPRADIQ